MSGSNPKLKQEFHDPFCDHEDCRDCPFCPTCTKDANEYDAKKSQERKDQTYCPRCGFIMGIDAITGKPRCLDCGYSDSDQEITKINLPDLDDGHDPDALDNTFYAEGNLDEWYGV